MFGFGFFPPHFPILEQFGWDEFSSLSAAKLVEGCGLLLRKCSLKTFSPFSSLMTARGLSATFSLPVPQFPRVHKGKVEQRKAVLHQGGLGCAFLCVMRTSAGMRLPRGQGASGSGPREAEPVARLWEEAGAECRAGLAFLSPGHTPWQGSARPIHELLASMLSCSQEFMLHLSSKQNNILGFLITSQRFFSSNISCGHFLPRQSLCLRAPACGRACSLPFSGCWLRTPVMLNFLLHFSCHAAVSLHCGCHLTATRTVGTSLCSGVSTACGWSCAVTVQGCGAACIEQVLRAAELLRLCDAAAGGSGGNQPPGTPWHGLAAWLLSWSDSPSCLLDWHGNSHCAAALLWKPQLQPCCRTSP